MGYAVNTFLDIDSLGLKECKVLDVGAQDVSIGSEQELECLNRFIKRNKPQNIITLKQFPKMLEAKEVYERAGHTYTCIDVDERPGALRVDLASYNIPRPRGRYSLVVNIGTTEHLASPTAAFALMHELCVKGGYLYHDVPLFGLGNHGLLNPTPKFWHALIWMNQYKPMATTVRAMNEADVEEGNLYHDYLSYFQGLAGAKNITYMIRCVLQKTTESIFVVPFDAIFPNSDDGRSLAKLLAGSYLPFVSTGAYTRSEVVDGINQFLKLNCRTYRARDYAELLNPGISAAGGKARGSIRFILNKLWGLSQGFSCLVSPANSSRS